MNLSTKSDAMTDASEIVKRLREAADLIESQQKQIEQLKAEADTALSDGALIGYLINGADHKAQLVAARIAGIEEAVSIYRASRSISDIRSRIAELKVGKPNGW